MGIFYPALLIPNVPIFKTASKQGFKTNPKPPLEQYPNLGQSLPLSVTQWSPLNLKFLLAQRQCRRQRLNLRLPVFLPVVQLPPARQLH